MTKISDQSLAVAQLVAEDLASEQKSINTRSYGVETELKNVLQYLTSPVSIVLDKQSLFDYLDACLVQAQNVAAQVTEGEDARKNASKYYSAIILVCERHLNAKDYDIETVSQILGWATRLIRYSKSDHSSGYRTSSDSKRPKNQPKPSFQKPERPTSRAWKRPDR